LKQHWGLTSPLNFAYSDRSISLPPFLSTGKSRCAYSPTQQPHRSAPCERIAGSKTCPSSLF
jgi:hypothetical protein